MDLVSTFMVRGCCFLAYLSGLAQGALFVLFNGLVWLFLLPLGLALLLSPLVFTGFSFLVCGSVLPLWLGVAVLLFSFFVIWFKCSVYLRRFCIISV